MKRRKSDGALRGKILPHLRLKPADRGTLTRTRREVSHFRLCCLVCDHFVAVSTGQMKIWWKTLVGALTSLFNGKGG